MKQSKGALARIRVVAGLVAVVLAGGVPVAEAALTFSANAIASDGAITISGAVGSELTLGAAAQVGTVSLGVSTAELTLNLGTGNGAKTINIGNGTGADSINIGTGGTAADAIIIGDSLANVSLTDAQWGITAPGAATFTGLTLTGFSGILKATAGVVAGSATTSDLTEGTNLYYTDTRARAALSGTAPINYTSATGVIALDTVGATKGGTGLTSYATGDLLYASAANTLSALAGNTTTTRKFLRQTGDGASSVAPAWDTVTKTDVGLGSVENTALTTWAGSTNLITLGAATATSVNKLTLTAPATTATLTIAEGKTLTASNTLTFSGTDGSSLAVGTGGTLGTGAYATIADYAPLVSPSFTTPALGAATGTSVVLTTSATIGAAGTATGSLLMKGTTSGTVTIKTADAAGTYTLTLPGDDGTVNQVLTTDGAGLLTWGTPAPGGITSLGGLTAGTQTFANDTNVTISSATSTHTLGWTGTLASSRGGTGNGFTKFSGPTTAEKTFTLPDASATILTTNAAVTVGQGGTGVTTIAAGSVLAANTINTLSAVTSTVDTKVLTNTAGTISWEAAAATGANTALSNLASVAINTALIPATAGGLDFGTTAKPWADLYLAGTSITPGTNQFKFTGASTGGLRTITLPDASGTVSLLGNTVTGSGSVVLATSPTLVTPDIGVATATSVNKLTLTAPATTATLTIAEGKTLTASNTLTFSGTDGSSLAIGTGGTLGTGAYATIANYAPLASPSFTTPNIGVATATSIAIGANTLDTAEWANLDGVNQGLATTSTPRFARVGLGQAADASAVLSATGQYFSTQYTTTTTLDWNNGNVQYIQLANNGQTFTFANPKSGARYMLILKQPASGAAGTVTWPATVRWPADTAPTLTTTNSRTDVITFVYDGTNTLYYGGASLNYFP